MRQLYQTSKHSGYYFNINAALGLLTYPAIFICVLLFLIPQGINAQVSGLVYRDYNANGTRDSSATFVEPRKSGITVKAYNAANAEVGSVVTAANGTYSFTGLTLPLRIEFTGLSIFDYSGPAGTGNSSSVQFYSSASSTANFGINAPFDYSQDSPPMIVSFARSTTSFFTGNSSPDGIREYSISSLGTTRYEAGTGTIPNMPSTEVASGAAVGNTQGLRWRRKTRSIFASAYARANDGTMGATDGIGPGGLGAIYAVTNGVVSTFATVTNVGTFDGSMGLVGKVGIGGIAISTYEDTLYAINMFAKTLVIIPINDNPLTAGTQTQIALPQPADCTGGQTRPFGVSCYKGKVYIGVVCGGPAVSDLRGYVYSYNGSSFQQELNFPMNYARTNHPDDNNTNDSFNNLNHSAIAWSDSPTTSLYTNGATTAENNTAAGTARFAPMLTEILFDDDDMVLGFRSRLSDQIVNSEWTIGGEVLHACGINSGGSLSWQLENNGVCPGDTTTSPPPVADSWVGRNTAQATSKGPGGYEYFWGDNGFEGEMVQGGLARYAGSDQLIVTQIDALGHRSQHGLAAISLNSGQTTAAGNVAQARYNLSGVSRAMKSNQMGDVELLSDLAPIEIGNRVWQDQNKNGIQDAGETGIGNVSIELFADFNNDSIPDGSALATTITATTGTVGTFYFNSANVTDGDPSVSGNQAGPQPGKNYIIRVGNSDWSGGIGVGDLSGLLLTSSNVGGAGQPDVRDNDAKLKSSIPAISVATGLAGKNDHTLDMGFAPCPTITNPSPAQSICIGANGTDITVSTDQNEANSIKFVQFTSAQSVEATIYGGTQIGSIVTPAGSSSPYTATYTWNSADFPNATGSPITYYVYAILEPDPGAGCRPYQEIQVTVKPLKTGSETYNGCQGDGYSVTVNGTVYNESNPSGTEVLTGSNGCDSTVTISLTWNVCCTQPTALSITQSAPGCTGSTPDNNGKITLTNIANADKFGVSAGASYSGSAYGAATPIGALPFDLQTAIPNTGGQYTIRLFNGANDCYKDTTVTIDAVFCCQPITLGPDPLPDGQVGTAYSVQVTATGGTGPYTFVWFPGSAGPLPDGLNIDPGGLVSGIPTTPGSYSATITVIDANMCPDTLDPAVIVINCTFPSPIFTKTAPTCSGATPNNDGKITLTAVSNADKYGISTGLTYSGPAYAGATAISLPDDVQSSIPNSGATYTIRLFNGSDDCYKDTTITIAAVDCTDPCAGVQQNYEICPGESYTLSVASGLTNIQWYKDNVLLSGEINPTLIVTSVGVYHYTANDGNGCPAELCCPITFSAGTNCCPAEKCLPVSVTRG